MDEVVDLGNASKFAPSAHGRGGFQLPEGADRRRASGGECSVGKGSVVGAGISATQFDALEASLHGSITQAGPPSSIPEAL